MKHVDICMMSVVRDDDSVCAMSVFPLICFGTVEDRRKCPLWIMSFMG